MGKTVMDYVVPAALGATGFGLAGIGPMAGLFGSGAAGAAETGGLLAGEVAGEALPALSDPMIANGLWDGVGSLPTAETMGASFVDGVPQTFGAKLESGMSGLIPGEWDWMKGAGALSGLSKLYGTGQTQEQPQMASAGSPVKPFQGMQGSFQDSNNMSQQEVEDLKRKKWMNNLGNPFA